MPVEVLLAEFTILLTPFWPDPLVPSDEAIELAPGIRFGRPPYWLSIAVPQFQRSMSLSARSIVDQTRWAITLDLKVAGQRADEGRGAIYEPALSRLTSMELAFWLARPSRASFLMFVHYEEVRDAGGVIERYFDSHAFRRHLRALDSYSGVRWTAEDFVRARDLLPLLEALQPGTTIATATTALMRALYEETPELRYVLLWIALEALFGPHEPYEATYRLRQAMSLFLAETREIARRIFRDAGSAYSLRSDIVHGRTATTFAKVREKMPDVEEWLRSALSKIIDGGLSETFSDRHRRSAYLEALPFAGKSELAAESGSGGVNP